MHGPYPPYGIYVYGQCYRLGCQSGKQFIINKFYRACNICMNVTTVIFIEKNSMLGTGYNATLKLFCQDNLFLALVNLFLLSLDLLNNY